MDEKEIKGLKQAVDNARPKISSTANSLRDNSVFRSTLRLAIRGKYNSFLLPFLHDKPSLYDVNLFILGCLLPKKHLDKLIQKPEASRLAYRGIAHPVIIQSNHLHAYIRSIKRAAKDDAITKILDSALNRQPVGRDVALEASLKQQVEGYIGWKSYCQSLDKKDRAVAIVGMYNH